jgi:hypothetical protein
LPRAKNIIFLHMVGGPSQIDLLDPKPLLAKYEGKPAPREALAGKQFAFIGPDATLLASPYRFAKHGRAGLDFSELLPHTAGLADHLTVVRSMRTDEFNHGTAELFMMTGSPRFGRPSFGSWVSYGLGSHNDDLPSFVVLVNGPSPVSGTPLWGAGFLPTRHQGVQFRAKGDPVLFLSDPPGMKRALRREVVSSVAQLNRMNFAAARDPEILTRVAQYELAFRMQTAVPDLMAIEKEPQAVLERYGAEPGKESFANSCLLARRMVERGVRFVQLYHANWDHHDSLFQGLPKKCREVDRPAAALVADLHERGLLDETIVVWTGEFGRTPLVQSISASGARTPPGRDHHRDAFSLWVAGGGFRAGYAHGETIPRRACAAAPSPACSPERGPRVPA